LAAIGIKIDRLQLFDTIGKYHPQSCGSTCAWFTQCFTTLTFTRGRGDYFGQNLGHNLCYRTLMGWGNYSDM
jgi:hypothetical protein